jgi:hypothetical protein
MCILRRGRDARLSTIGWTLLAIAACAHPLPPEPRQASPLRSEPPTPIPLADARRAFADLDAACRADAGALWGRSLCGPVMIVDPATRFTVANEVGGTLVARDGLYVGTLPADQGIANTAIDWAGKHWSQVVWPLPDETEARTSLLVHEQFHRIEPELGLSCTRRGDNAHLDELDGRYLLQLEWRALAAALHATAAADRERALADALAFRAQRRRAFPDAAAREDALELCEGLAQYTGIVVGARSDAIATTLHGLVEHVGDPSFVRSFAYATGPAYGVLLDRTSPGWRTRIAQLGSLTAGIAVTAHEPDAAAYGGAALHVAETERAERRAAERARYRSLLVDGPLLLLPRRGGKIVFKPNAVLPLGDLGSIYPTLQVIDEWGTLDVTGGALLSTDWSTVAVAAPASAADRTVAGAWTLSLAPGWSVVPGRRSGDFTIARP